MNQNKVKIVIIGASGFGREVFWTIRECNDIDNRYDVLGFIDDNSSLHGQKINGLPILGDINWLSRNLNKNVKCENIYIRKHKK